MIQSGLVRDPVYKQLNDALRRLITTGEFGRGSKFLSEREIGERFSVSRATANKALSTLVAEGVLAFKKGVGTFVQGSGRSSDWRRLVSFDACVMQAGQVPTTRVQVAERIAELALDVRERLALEQGEGAFYLERVRLADAEPLILERHYVAERYCPGLLREDLSRSLRLLYGERYGLEIGGVVQSLRAVPASNGEAELLDLAPGAPCLLVTRLGQLVSGSTLWWEQSLYRGDACELSAQLIECSLLTIAPARESRPRQVKQA
jgi:GntR family transcriptional regulator